MKDLQKRLDNSEILDLVKGHPFFRGVTLSQSKELIEECYSHAYQEADVIFHPNQTREGLLLILNGVAEVYVHGEQSNRQEVLEVVQKGDIVGFSSLANFLGISKSKTYEQMVGVRAVEQVDGLIIPFSVVEKRWQDEEVKDYLLHQVIARLKDIYTSLAEQVSISRQLGESDRFIVRVQEVMANTPVCAPVTTQVQEIAQIMMTNAVSSVLIMNDNKLVGIITERDLVNRVIAKSKPYDLQVEHVMTKAPFTISRFSYFYDALSTMLLNGIKHLPVMDEDGERVVGVVALDDLLRKKNEGMMKTIKSLDRIEEDNLPQIKNAVSEVLETLITDNVPITHTLDMVTTLLDRLVKRCVQLAIESIKQKDGKEPPVAFSWYMMGSAGRGEQFVLTDQDHFLVYEDVSPDRKEEVEAYFQLLGEEIVIQMERAGYARCEGLMMSSEGQWRGSLSRWQERIRKWMLQATNDNILLAQNFFSFRLLYGSEHVHDEFKARIMETMERSKIFLYRMAQVEKESPIPKLEHPIRSLFRLDRKKIDVKKEILFPFHHGLQILCLANGIIEGTPLERIDKLAHKHIITESFATDLKTAFEEVMAIYVERKWNQYKRGEKSSSIFTFTHLTTREKEELMLTLKTFRELQGQMFGAFAL